MSEFISNSDNVARPSVAHAHRSASRGERGIALILTLLILAMVTALSVGMVVALCSQTLIGGYYRNARASFYAADSGLNIARQEIVTQIDAAVPSTFATPPLANPVALATSINQALASSYGTASSSTAALLIAGQSANSWKENFQINSESVTLASGPTVTSYDTSTGSCTPTIPCPTAYQYVFSYSISSQGMAQGSEQQNVTENGLITLNITGHQAILNVSFAYFGAFIDKYAGCLGALVPGTMTGPMFTNGAWEFESGGGAPYIFTDPVGQAGADAYYWDQNGCNASPNSSWVDGNTVIAPTFQAGFNVGQTPVALPTNSYSQEWAVLDGLGTGEGSASPTNAQLHSTLVNVAGASYPVGGAASGIYFNAGTTAAACGSKSPPCMAGGGFYVEGNTTLKLTPSGATAQVYTMTQNGVTTTITVDPAAASGVGTTTVTQSGSSGNVTQVYSGVPENLSTGSDATMVYVDGSVTSLYGGGEGQPAIQDNAMITLTALNDITATGDVLYKTEPVTVPADALIPSVTNMNQVLGIYTANGNFDLNNSQGDSNIQVDGSIATISSQDSANNCANGEGGFLDTGGWINVFNNVGGQIQSCIYGANINVENVWFDRRFTSRPNFAPPWFPSTQIQQGGPLQSNPTTQIQRLQWLNNSAL